MMNTLFKRTWRLKNCIIARRFVGSAQKMIDLRSDTVTKPTVEMRKAMFDAAVGDDVYKEDESINQLEKLSASLFGMEKALFVPSGTMGNLLCLMVHCNGRGEELIIGGDQHVYVYEQGHFMQFASIAAKVIPNEEDGTMDISSIERSIKNADDFHCSETKLICLENTHMNKGGLPLSNEYLRQVSETAKKHDIRVHVDGARIFNAAVATNQPISDLLSGIDSVSMCLSKGLGCPVGSVIGGSEQFIQKALRIRKALGGGMRQAGFLAAAGLHALEHGHVYIQRDHANAKVLAEGINMINRRDLLKTDLNKIKTNIVFAESSQEKANEIVAELLKRNIKASAFSSSRIRFVLHHDVREKDVVYAINSLREILENKL